MSRTKGDRATEPARCDACHRRIIRGQKIALRGTTVLHPNCVPLWNRKAHR